MAVSYSREELGRGISLTRIYDKKFKSNCVKIAFISPLNEKTALLIIYISVCYSYPVTLLSQMLRNCFCKGNAPMLSARTAERYNKL